MTNITTQIIAALNALEGVEKVAEWNGRHYVNLAAARGSRANADLKTKIWLKGSVLTIEQGKGYNSSDYLAARNAVMDAVRAAGGTIREV